MPKHITIGNTAVSISDLRKLSGGEKIQIIEAMFDECGLETDEAGQIVQYTGLMYGDEDGETIVPLKFDGSSENDDNLPDEDPYETEEEPEEPVSQGYKFDDTLPPTLRPSQMPPAF